MHIIECNPKDNDDEAGGCFVTHIEIVTHIIECNAKDDDDDDDDDEGGHFVTLTESDMHMKVRLSPKGKHRFPSVNRS